MRGIDPLPKLLRRPCPLYPVSRKTEKPLLRLRSQFAPLVILSRHPIRLILMILIPGAALPEMIGAIKWFSDFNSIGAFFFLMTILAIFILLPPLIIAALDCRHIRYDFHIDHLVFTENFFLRDKIKISYRSVRDARLRRSFLQQFSGVSDILLETAAGTQATVTIPDIKNGAKALSRIQEIIKKYHTGIAEHEQKPH